MSRLKNWQSKEERLNLKGKKKENDGEIIKKNQLKKWFQKKIAIKIKWANPINYLR